MEQAASATEPIEGILQPGTADPDASIAGLLGAVNVRFGAAVESLVNRRVENSTTQFRAILALLGQADVLSSQGTASPRSVRDYLVAVEAAAADERQTAVALGAPVGEAFRLGHSMRCFGRATAPLLEGRDAEAHEALVASGATVLALISDLRYVGDI